jgi:hypothetical protein
MDHPGDIVTEDYRASGMLFAGAIGNAIGSQVN